MRRSPSWKNWRAEQQTNSYRAAARLLRLAPVDVHRCDGAAAGVGFKSLHLGVGDQLDVRMLQCGPDTPHAVVINEALELARTFSTEDAVKFINGMLDAIRKKLDAQL